ncbi:tyrosinase family protein [Janthinobacterium agaricidamnosum]|uniref:Common central domain of tyrosinase family protein n=1 Tax=Janthinobacterium agaricidamnosum NBRC 102515 = DSM 9628 TaxID=1349767 RepID=W0V0D2_9BURK|nr:tyrosinase family protein [Janthinobacterium agaricidamnosum]CDG82289.1 common central domain of tyrosinase family protein [Janthinobacterium agaricidamnosum NBRC 102515 = DSM 9628]
MSDYNYSQRFFIVAASSLLLGVGSTAALADPTRISVAEFSKNPQMVEALTKGVASMRQFSSANPMSEQFRTSLAYWANTHGYIGTGTHATSMQKYIIEYRIPQCLKAFDKKTCAAYYQHVVNVKVPNDGYTDTIWGTCQHGNLFFLPWHRFYLHFFERTLRKQSKAPNLALPYWSYYDNYMPSKNKLALPPLVTNQASPLYDQWRTPGLNQLVNLMDPDSADATQAFGFNDFTGFSNQLQNQPHGTMHCEAGSGCTMPDIGLVPIAGADPVFYMHHANIDRLWQCWMKGKAKGQPITLAWARANLGMSDAWFEQQYTFIDENGKPVKVKVADVFSAAYTPQYDHLDNCDARPDTMSKEKSAGLKAWASSPLTAHAPLAAGKKITLGNSTVSVGLQAAAEESGTIVKSLGAAAAEAGQTYLVLEDVQLQGAPALTYKVYLSSKSQPQKSSYIATFSYFGVGPVHASHAGHGSDNALGTLVYKVNANLAELGISSASDITVRFVPADLASASQAKNQQAGTGVTVANIRLETSAIAPSK